MGSPVLLLIEIICPAVSAAPSSTLFTQVPTRTLEYVLECFISDYNLLTFAMMMIRTFSDSGFELFAASASV